MVDKQTLDIFDKAFTPPNLNMWKSAFDQGTLSFKQDSLDRALEAFTKAIELGGKKAVVYDYRAAVLERMGRYKEALEDTRAVIELLPESHKGYTRSSRLFELRSRYSQAHKMLSIALPLCPPSLRDNLAAKLPDLAAKRDAQQKALEKFRRSYIKMLPYELLFLIANYLLIDNSDIALQLAAVCRDWRNFCLHNSSLWSNLRVGKRRAMKKATAFLKRSGGRIKEIWFEKVDVTASEDLSKLLSTNLQSLVSIRIDEEAGVRTILHVLTYWQGQLQPGVLESIRFSSSSEHAASYPEDFENRFWRLYCTRESDGEDSQEPAVDGTARIENSCSQTCALESLQLHNFRMKTFLQIPVWLGPLPLLKTLRLSHVRIMCLNQPVDHSFRKFLLSTPNLVSLVVERKSILETQTAIASSPTQIIPLTNLQVLALDFYPFQYGSDLRFDHPELETLRLCSSNSRSPARNVYQTHLFNEDQDFPTDTSFMSSQAIRNLVIRPKPCADRLTQLILSQTRIEDEALFISHLRHLPALEALYADGCHLTNRTVEALILNPDRCQDWICSRLKTLNMSHTEGISGTPICKMVASRLTSSASSMPSSSPSITSRSRSSSRPPPPSVSSSFTREQKPNTSGLFAPSLPLENLCSIPSAFPTLSLDLDLPSANERRIPINLLILDGCVNIEPKAIEWLQCKIVNVKSRYMDPNNPRGASRSFIESVSARQGGY